MNGSFLLENRNDGVYLQVKKADNGGVMPGFEELMYYMDKKKVPYGSVVELKRAFEHAENGTAVKICDTPVTPFDGWCEYDVASDSMSASVIMYPAFAGRREVSLQEIQGDLNSLKIKSGVDGQLLQTMIFERRFFEKMVFATGSPAKEGYDAEIIYHFNTKVDLTPKLNEDGSVDFHQLDLINSVAPGDVVATIKPEYPGEEGKDIKGTPLRPKKVARKVFRFGRDLRVSSDGLRLIAEKKGHIILQSDDKIILSGEFEITSDVNTATGDIDFDGDVRVRGVVRAGFKVHATGDIRIDGVVEGAEIVAGGNIVLQRGIQGMNKGSLTAGGNIVTNFIENATVKAGQNIETDAILHSKVAARGSITVQGKNGYLIGGDVRAGSIITAKIIGSEMGTNTVVSVGSNPEIIAKIDELKKEMMKTAKDKEQLNQVVSLLRKKSEAEGKLAPDKQAMLQKSMMTVVQLDSKIKEIKGKLDEITKYNVDDKLARVKVLGSIYPGVKIEIGDVKYFIREKNDFCQYIKTAGEITRVNM